MAENQAGGKTTKRAAKPADKGPGGGDEVLATIAAMPEPDRAMASGSMRSS